jgi:hypothetical protein
MKITIKYEQGQGIENLVHDPMRKNHLIWIPF